MVFFCEAIRNNNALYLKKKIQFSSSYNKLKTPAYELYQYRQVLRIIEDAKKTSGILTVEFLSKYDNIWRQKLDPLTEKDTKMLYCAKNIDHADKIMCDDYIDSVTLSIGDGQIEHINDKMTKMLIDRIVDAVEGVTVFSKTSSSQYVTRKAHLKNML